MELTNWKEKAEEKKETTPAQTPAPAQNSRLIQMCKESKAVMIVVAVFMLVIIGTLAVITFSEKKEEVAATAAAETAAGENTIVVPEEALEKDAYSEVNNLIKQYYQALVSGDMETIKTIKNYVDEEE